MRLSLVLALVASLLTVAPAALTGSPAQAAGAVYRAVNLNGPAVTAGGIAFESGVGAPDVTAGPNAFCNRAVTLVPATDEATASMVRCSVWGSGSPGARVSMSRVPSGTYEVSLYVWEDNASETFSLVLNGATAAANVVSGAAGSWKVLGPYPVSVSGGTIAVSTSGGAANLSGLVVRSSGGTSTNRPPAVTSPGAQSSIRGTAISPLQIVASDPDAGQTLRFTATGLPAGLAIDAATGTISSTPTTAQTTSVTVTATDNGSPVAGGSTTFSWTVTAPSGTGFDPAKVTDTFIAGGNWTKAVSADWLGNGHIVVLTQGGIVYDVTPSTGAQSVLLNLTAKVNDAGEAGSLDILVDPTGAGFWVYYTVEGSDRLRISHFSVGSSVERVVWTNPGLGYDTANPYHVGGALDLGPDGKLYLSIGDRVQGRSNDLTNVFGKILRINQDGTVPSGNPFADGAGPNVDEIWAHGLRNPYRASFDDATGLYWVGDVGGNIDSQAYEEVDIVEAGKNYGWPACEGPLGPPKNGPTCPAGVTGPVHSYGHDVNGGCCSNRAIVGGEIYRGSVFPLSGHYVYADYPSDTFTWLRLGSDGRTAAGSGLLTKTTVQTPVWLGAGPDGYIYWLSLGWGGNGQLRRLGYSGAVDRPPTITTVTATPRSGAAPLSVTFTSAASDPDGTAVTYAWDFGDGTTSTQASPSHAYTTNGSFAARLQVTSGGRTVSSDPIPIAVGAAPTVAITGPVDGTTFTAGQTFTLTGTGNDPDTGALTGSALTWDISFMHGDHSHPGAAGTGQSTTFTIPSTGHDFAGDTRYRVTLTATDPDGLKATTSIVLRPVKASVTVRSSQAASMTVDNITQTLPHAIDTLVGFQHSISVPISQCVTGRLWTFSAWSDGGARTHTITSSAGLDLIATYVDAGSSCATAGTLRVSLSSTRANARDLQGTTVSRTSPVYVFLDPGAQSFTRVEFWLDAPVTTAPRQVEGAAPWDFAGGTTTTANPFNPSGLALGSHTIAVRVTRSGGATEVMSTTFTVA